jgi:hypothetical protein
MANLRAQVVFHSQSGKPEDRVVNTFHFQAGTHSDGTAEAIKNKLASFYNVSTPIAQTGGTGIAGYLSNSISRGTFPAEVRVYNLADPKPRLPIVKTFILGNASDMTALELPSEVALCLSFFGTRNLPRLRGRVYLGPFLNTALSDDSGAAYKSRPAPNLVDTIRQAAKGLLQGFTEASWAVWSNGLYTVNKVPQPPVPGSSALVTAGWVDNAWDTQRRRGFDASTRLTYSATFPV